ncbi:MAG: iron-sulfur cluster assembly scaffold protein [Planctomycetota bacterium]
MPKFTDIVMDHFQHPRNVGRLDSPTNVGIEGEAGRAPYMVIQLRVQDERIVDARFQTFGCGAAIAAGSMLTEMILGRDVPECLRVTENELNEALGGLPADKLWCAQLPVAALRRALDSQEPRETPRDSH